MQVIDGRDKVQVDLSEQVAILVLFDILQGEFLHYGSLTIEIADVRLNKDVAEDQVFLILTCTAIIQSISCLVFLQLFDQDIPVFGQIKKFLHGARFR